MLFHSQLLKQKITGLTANMMLIDDMFDLTQGNLFSGSEQQELCAAMKSSGITPPKYAFESLKGFNRFITYALKKARSKHINNARWKCVHEICTAFEVARRLK